LLPNKNKPEKMLQQFLLLNGTSPTPNIIIKHYGHQGIRSLLIFSQESTGHVGAAHLSTTKPHIATTNPQTH
jgi:hypothetical protein